MEIYTDGSCSNKIGGVGVIVVSEGVELERYLTPLLPPTTNNHAELLGLYQALKLAKSNKVTIFTDSEYSLKAVTVWSKQWEKNGWLTAKGKPVLNQTLIRKCMKLVKPNVKIQHVRAHSGNKWNVVADQVANSARMICMAIIAHQKTL